MIPASTQSMQGDALRSGPAGASRASKKKNADASLFSALVEKARSPKGAAGSAAAAAADRPPAVKQVSVSAAAVGQAVAPSPVKAPAGAAVPALVPPAAVPKERTLRPDSEASADSDVPGLGPRKGARAAARGRRERSAETAESAAELASVSAASAAQAPSAARRNAPASFSGQEARVEPPEDGRKDRKKGRLEIDVYDRRREEAAHGAAAVPAAAKPGSDPSAERASGNVADLTVRLREGSPEAGREGAAPAGSETRKTSFSDALARELRGSYGGDIVRQASVVLKDGGEGLIRLSLKPETLGSVKIKLELADNKIAGRILVETDEALKAFGKELRSLEQAFVDGGFDGASLELALSSGDAGSGGRGRSDGPAPFFSERLIASEYDSSVPEAAAPRSFAGREDALVDVLA